MKTSKRLFSLLLCLVMLLSAVPISAFAATEITAGNYTYTVSGDNATIVSYYEKAEGRVVIPSKLGGKTVTAIGDRSFQACTVVNEIIIPSTVKTIGKYAFSFCYSLTKIEIPESVTSIGDNAFRNSKKVVIYCQKESYAHKYAQKNGISFVLSGASESSGKPFDENTYIADVWLSRNRAEKTNENRYIDELLSYDSISSPAYLELRKNKAFMSSVEIWESMEIIFDPVKQTKEVYNAKLIYEALIMDLLEKVSVAKSREVNSAILNAAETVGEVADGVTKYKGIVDAIADLASGTSKSLLEILKKWKFDPKDPSFTKFYGSLNNISDTVDDKWSNSKFIEGIGILAELTSDVTTFFERFTGYVYVADMAEEMAAMLKKMREHTAPDSFFRVAINDVLKAFENIDYAAVIMTCDLGGNLALDVADALFEEGAKWVPGYGQLRNAYKLAKGFTDLIYNTSNIIDKYYLLQASYDFINAARSAVGDLKNAYISSGTSTDAGAYVYAVRSFRYVYEIDIESALDFTKAAEFEGVANKVKLGADCVWGFFTGQRVKTSYEKMAESKETILDCIDLSLYWLSCSWKFNYLEEDYPEIYPLYIEKEISQDRYKPQITSCYIEKSGKTDLEWCIPIMFSDRDGNIYPLYANVNGIVASETVAGKKKEVSYNAYEAPNPLQFYNGAYFKTFNKKYKIKGYSTTVSAGNVYTKETEQVLAYPLVTPEIEIALDRDTLSATKKGIPIKITDYSKSEYSFMKYQIYRKINNSKWELIDTVERRPKYGTYSTVYYDEKARSGYEYSYKVVSYLTFDNGVTLKSPESNIFGTENLGEKSVKKDLTIERRFERKPTVRKMSLSRAAASKENDTSAESSGIKITWEKVNGAAQYEIYRLTSFGNVFRKIGTVSGENLSYIDTDLANGCEYTYRVVPCSKKNSVKTYDLNTYAEGVVTYEEKHTDNNGDGKCDICGEKTGEVTPPQPDPSANCTHICHKGGISAFFYKIALFFWKLFKTHKECSCGAMHY